MPYTYRLFTSPRHYVERAAPLYRRVGSRGTVASDRDPTGVTLPVIDYIVVVVVVIIIIITFFLLPQRSFTRSAENGVRASQQQARYAYTHVCVPKEKTKL